MSLSLENNRYLAKTLAGLEEALAEELQKFGAEGCQPVTRAVLFRAGHESLYRINLRSRLAISIVLLLGEWTIRDEEELYDQVREVPWENFLRTEQTFVVRSTVHSKAFTHSHFIALKAKDAIADRFRDTFGRRPDVDTDHPDVPIYVHIRGNILTLGLDSSGDPLFKRGYRQRRGRAPLNEVLAAGIVKLSGWNGENLLVDPMCGSGTLAIEGALYGSNRPPQSRGRTFAFENWPDFDAGLWLKIKREKMRSRKDIHVQASDMDLSLTAIAMENARAAGVQDLVSFQTADFFDLEPAAAPATLLMNPPYDLRLKSDDIGALYKKIGDRLKQKWTGSTAWIFTANLDAAKHIGLRPSKKIPLYNGPHEGRLLRFELF